MAAWATVGEVLTRRTRTVEVKSEHRYKMFGVRNYSRGAFDAGELRGVETKYKALNKAAAGDLVYLKLGAWERAFAIIPPELDGHHASSEFILYAADLTRIDGRYLAHLVAWPALLDRVGSKSKGTNVRRRRLSPELFEAAMIPLPDLDTQRKIAARLDEFARQSSALSEVTALRGAPDEIAPKVVSEVLGSLNLPEVPVGDLYEAISDVVQPESDHGEARRFVGLEHIARHVGAKVGQSDVANLKGRKLRFAEGDVLYGYLRPYLNKAWVADGPGLCSVEQYVLRPRDGVDSRLLGHVLRSQATLDAANAATHSLQLPRIRSGLLAQITVPEIRLAPRGFADRLDSVNERALHATSLTARSRELMSSLLSAARNEEFRKLIAG